MAEVALRLAAPADAARIAAIFTASRDLLTFLPRLHTAEEDVCFIAEQIMPHYRLTVAEIVGGGMAGYIADGPGWIEQLYLDPDRLRRGIGSLLLADAQARNTSLELWCFAQNDRGRAFYERHGFAAVEETDGAGNAEHRPDIRYRWSR